jgi:hypothetical protein
VETLRGPWEEPAVVGVLFVVAVADVGPDDRPTGCPAG